MSLLQAQQLVLQCPTVLKLPIETKLQPLLGALTTLGLTGGQVADLLRSCPQLLAQSKDGIVSRCGGQEAHQHQQRQPQLVGAWDAVINTAGANSGNCAA